MNNSETVRDWGDTGGAELLEDISADGKTVLLGTGGSVVVLNLNDPVSKRRPLPILQTGEVINGVRFSPDGRWVVYRARTSQNQSLGIYVQPFPSGGLQSQISTGGSYPVWRPDGKEMR